MTLFKERLKYLRKKNKMTQKELADLLNVSKSTISGYENGSYQPSFDKLIRIANIFDVPLDFFYINMQMPRAEYISSVRVAVLDTILPHVNIMKELANVHDGMKLNILYYRNLSKDYQSKHREYFILLKNALMYTIHLTDKCTAGDTVLAHCGENPADIYFCCKENGQIVFADSRGKLYRDISVIGTVAEVSAEEPTNIIPTNI